MAERRRQGLCYNCDEQFVRGHKCPRLFFLEVADPEEEVPNLMDDPLPVTDAEPFISLNAITGIRGEDTMQVRVTIGTHEFTALLDSGSTTNFISLAAGRAAHLMFQSGGGAYVRVANGDRVDCSGLARDVAIRIGQEEFTIDCFSIPLDCHDLVLGVTFLRTLGPVLWDFDEWPSGATGGACFGKVLAPHAGTLRQPGSSTPCATTRPRCLHACSRRSRTCLLRPLDYHPRGLVITAYT
jgi:hypothetical protein